MLTLPQIELMQSDLPHTLYNTKKKGGKDGETAKERAAKHTKASDKVIRMQEEANRQAEIRRAKKEGREPQYKVEDIFK